MARFFIRNFGCRASQADGAALSTLLESSGHEPASGAAGADLVVLNSCTVTSAADDDIRQAVRRAHRENPFARILVTGCYAQRAPEEVAALPGVNWVAGNTHKTAIARIVAPFLDYHSQISAPAPMSIPGNSGASPVCGASCGPGPGGSAPAGVIHIGDIGAEQEFLAAPVLDAGAGRTRPNLKIQDGCDNFCTFCVIPSVRGRGRSAPAGRVIEQVRSLAGRYREVVLSGINLGRWGRDAHRRADGVAPGMRLADLLRRLLDETPVERLRLSSVEPMDFSDSLLRLMADSPRIAPHVHAPLQSASDPVLKRMKRRYRSRHYAWRVQLAREWMPDAAIGADVMTGFPGETPEEFEETRRFIEEMPFTYLHVFTYSERPGTPAAAYANPVPVPVRKERNAVLRDLAARKNAAFRERFVGRTLSAVTLDAHGDALSGNFLRIELARPRIANQLIDVRVGGLTAAGLAEANPLSVLV